ncbi:MAG: putative sugar nucleotidyl transferase [Gemmatimonas sp.]|uniref:putative sugar nucleotidyl transferase n=1 Tax=Gemmatimonas sp. TaxID=1962908 RepID=UPI00391F5307|nr:hypothetical protein [Gemmatimonadota bacterium]
MIVLYDDLRARHFEPFATSRPLGELRAGALLIRERWQHVLGTPAMAFVSSAHLEGFAEFEAPPFATAEIPAGTWIVNTRAVPALDTRLGAASAILLGNEVAAARLADPLPVETLRAGTFSLDRAVPASGSLLQATGPWLQDVWDLVGTLGALLTSDIPLVAQTLVHESLGAGDSSGAPAPLVTGTHPVYVETGAHIEPLSVFDTSAGPVLVRRGATVQAFTRIIGPCYIGVDSTVTADRIAGSSIGDTCRVHGELSASILVGHANKGHDGFVGHSVLGRWVNLGAGTITSNLKNTYGSVALWTPTGVRDSGLQFLGTLFGDHAKTGIGLRLTTGCVLGAGANVFGAMPPKVVAPFAWGGQTPSETFAAAKFVETAGRMMTRRQVTLGPEQQAWWRRVHMHAVADTRWPR